jgi:hypothetical protein
MFSDRNDDLHKLPVTTKINGHHLANKTDCAAALAIKTGPQIICATLQIVFFGNSNWATEAVNAIHRSETPTTRASLFAKNGVDQQKSILRPKLKMIPNNNGI